MTRRQIDALTGVRGIAAWWVVLYHIRVSLSASLPTSVIAVFAKGYLAVDLFFVLSGFVLWLTWGRRFGAEGWRVAPEFLRKRVARVWPLHAVVLAATLAFALTLQATGRPLPAHYRWAELPLHLLLVQNWGFTSDLGWNDPSWSISTEMAAYLAFAGIASLLGHPRERGGPGSPTGGAKGKRDSRVRSYDSIWAALAALILIAALDRLFAWHGSALLGADIAHLGLARCLAEFGCGVAMCVVWQRENPSRLVVATGAVASVALTLDAGDFVRETFAIPLAFTALVPLLAATSSWRLNPLSSRVAILLGEISYSTYLAHFLLWTLFKIVLVHDASAVGLWAAASFLALTLAASSALHHWVELPARRLLSGNPAAV